MDWLWPFMLVVSGILLMVISAKMFSSTMKGLGSMLKNLNGLYETETCPLSKAD